MLVPLNIEILLDNNFPSFVVKSVHLVNGLPCHVCSWELHDAGAPRLARLIIEKFNIANLSNLLPEQVLHLLPLHLIGKVRHKDPLFWRPFPHLPSRSTTISTTSTSSVSAR